MDSSFSPKDETWFLHVCHHISDASVPSQHQTGLKPHFIFRESAWVPAHRQCPRFWVPDSFTCNTGTWNTKQLPELAAKIQNHVLIKVFRCIFLRLFQWYSEMLVQTVNQRHKNWQSFRNAGTFAFKRQIMEYVHSASHSCCSQKSYQWLPCLITSSHKPFALSMVGKISGLFETYLIWYIC